MPPLFSLGTVLYVSMCYSGTFMPSENREVDSCDKVTFGTVEDEAGSSVVSFNRWFYRNAELSELLQGWSQPAIITT